ncbi:MAG TPA: homoserine O-acetyltransferase [Chitinophagaceae bacterium]|nr:homoserine O-acetyltransferase [Chitinophagaceae bacterium]
MAYNIFKSASPISLESGNMLPGFHLGYTTHGQLNEVRDNVVWVFHALTANSDATEWWHGLVGEGKLFDPANYFIVCANIPGSCYGSIGPLDLNPETNEPYYHEFPFFTIKDIVKTYQELREYLDIKKIHIAIGGSMGGQQLLEWAIEEPELFEFIFPIATNAFHSAWGIAFNESQRLSIECDATWEEKNSNAGINGMKVARGIALISYRNYITYNASQAEDGNDKIENFKTSSYQRYQGEKLAKRFNAFSYYFLSKGMDSHNVGRGRYSVEAALQQIRAKTLVIGITTDILFPVSEQQLIADNIPGATFTAIHSNYGHDGFLLEFEQIEKLITDFLTKQTVVNYNLNFKVNDSK